MLPAVNCTLVWGSPQRIASVPTQGNYWICIVAVFRDEVELPQAVDLAGVYCKYVFKSSSATLDL